MTLSTVKVPTIEQLRDVAADLGMSFTEEDLAAHMAALVGGVAAYNIVDQMPDELPAVKYPRLPGRRPAGEENKHNAWYVKTRVEGASGGKLKGKTVVLKDNICLAGVPMMNGAATLEGYVPDVDATVATRVLDAGGTIVGKAVCEYFCFSGGSHTSASGPVHNAHRMGYSAGGSSSGSATLVALGEVDMALGGDQGGSIRMPSAYSGTYGMKPTHGLVPYTGIMPIELTIDHTGPITGTVEDNALLLEVLAGPDGLDPRQYGGQPQEYRAGLGKGVAGLRIAVVPEGFGHPQSMAKVDDLVRAAAERFKALGATVDTVSIPMHLLGPAIWLPVAAEGATMQMMLGNGFGFNWQGLYVTSMLDFHSAWRQRADELSDTLKNTMLLGHYMVKHYRGHYYAKAQNLVRRLRAAYDAVLANYDLLLMPTVPLTATPLPEANAPIPEILQRAFEMLPNTSPFDCTHHPAMSVPCGMADGLPVGVQLVGKLYDESTIYRAAAAFEKAADWKKITA
ncbi:MAG TPA: amidase [Acetobacteraceae bacterium]|nr:amidase [Acetobacteraceae bacterium]